MISEQQQEQAGLYVLGGLTPAEQKQFEVDLGLQPELRALVQALGRTMDLVARAQPQASPPAGLRAKILQAVTAHPPALAPAVARTAGPTPLATDLTNPAFFFIAASDPRGWKALPVPGAYLKLLSADPQRGYAVLLGRIDRGVRYPAHAHETPEDFLILTGDLTVAGRRLGPGDFHHCDAGTEHPVNYSDEGCTLLAVLGVEHELVRFAMA